MTSPNTHPARDVLLLLTADYPYGLKETYLHEEIPFLASQFEMVLIVSGATDRSQSRPLPPNVNVIELNPPTSRLPLRVRLTLWWATIAELWAVVFRYRLLPARSLLGVIRQFTRDGARIAAGMQEALRSRGIRPDRVVAYSYWAMDSAMGCALLKVMEPRVVSVTRAHGYDVYFERHGLAYRPFRRFLLQHLDRFFVVSGHGVAYTANKSGVRLHPVLQVRYLGAKGPASQPLDVQASKPFTIVTCAALIPLKRIDLFIEALAVACDERPGVSIHWQHFGGGPLESAIAAQAARLFGGRAHLTYTLAGQVPHGVIEHYFMSHQVDLLVSASQWEGLPVSMMEAMAHGVPVITAAVGGCTEIVRDGFNGFVLPGNPRPEELGAAIVRCIDMPSTAWAVFRRAALETWKQRFDVERNYADFAAELKALQ